MPAAAEAVATQLPPDEAGLADDAIVVERESPQAATLDVDAPPASAETREAADPAASAFVRDEAAISARSPSAADAADAVDDIGEVALRTAEPVEPLATEDMVGAPDLQLDLPLDGDAPPPGDIRIDTQDTPSFVRKAERAARWRSPRMRAALAAGCAVAAVALAAQWLIAQRDLVGARSASLKPWLEAACAALGCEVRAPRSLQSLRVEASGVVRIERSDLYRLSVSLRNLGAHAVALPALELALTDTQGQLIARRVLRAGELGARTESLTAGAELTLQSTIQVASGTVAGYTIELFYP